MRFICISLVALSSFSIIGSSTVSFNCEALKGIERVKITCLTERCNSVNECGPFNGCFLECANTGYFEKEDWKNIFCKTVDNITSWYTKNDERVTLQMIKDENLCKNSSQEESSGRRRREALPCYMPRGWLVGGQDYC